MIFLYILAFLLFVFWIWCRVCYYILRQPTDTFWRFLRRELISGGAAFVVALDIVVKVVTAIRLTALIIQIWQLF